MFWYAQGILFIDYLEKGKTINNKYYIGLLVRLKEEIDKTKRQMKKKKKCSFTITMHHVTMMVKLYELHFELLPHPHPILQIVPSVTTDCLQTSKECSRERDLAPVKK